MCTDSVNSTLHPSFFSLDSPTSFIDYLSHNIHTFGRHLLELCGLNDDLWLLSPTDPHEHILSFIHPTLYAPASLFFLSNLSSRPDIAKFMFTCLPLCFPYIPSYPAYLHIISYSQPTIQASVTAQLSVGLQLTYFEPGLKYSRRPSGHRNDGVFTSRWVCGAPFGWFGARIRPLDPGSPHLDGRLDTFDLSLVSS